MINILIKHNHLKTLDFILDLNDSDFDLIIAKYISPKRIYQDLIRIVIKKTHDNLFNDSTRGSRRYETILSDNSLFVGRSSVFYEFRRVLGMYFLVSTLTYYSEKYKTDDLDVHNLSLVIRNFIWQNTSRYRLQV
jgi:hypothetical protein